jgi:hypothetical protein
VYVCTVKKLVSKCAFQNQLVPLHQDARHGHRVLVGRAKVAHRVRDDQHEKPQPAAAGGAVDELNADYPQLESAW